MLNSFIYIINLLYLLVSITNSIVYNKLDNTILINPPSFNSNHNQHSHIIKIMDLLANKTIGFIGCGKISSAICKGYAKHAIAKDLKKILISSRSVDKSKALQSEFPALIEIIEDNQEIVSNSDIIFIGLLPGIARSILPTLHFTSKQLIYSMLAAVDYNEMLSLLNMVVSSDLHQEEEGSSSNVVKIVPLPSSANGYGPALMFPYHHDCESILKLISTPIICKDEKDMKPMIALTGHISTFYELMNTSQLFMISHGIQEDVARQFITSFYSSLAQSAENSHETLPYLCDEAATPGGLNEQVDLLNI